MSTIEDRYRHAPDAVQIREPVRMTVKATRPVTESTEPIMVRIRVMRQAARGMARALFILALGICGGIALAMLWPREASAQAPQCLPYGKMLEYLSTRYREKLTGLGMISPNAIVQLFASEAGTWTILAIGRDGQACVMSSGTGWEQLPTPEKGRPA